MNTPAESGLRILVGNDDGIDAPGIALLAAAARTLTDDVLQVAPERKWTAASHQLSFDRTLTLSRRDAQRHACSGAPADCVIAAMTLLCADRKPDLVLAGINDKVNVAEDVAYSGTMAVAREAALWGVPAIALSSDASFAAGDVASIGALLQALWRTREHWHAPGAWLSLNLPPRLPAPLVEARTGRDKIGAAVDVVEAGPDRTTFRLARGRTGASSGPGDEYAVLARGAIAVVRLRWDCALPLGAQALAAIERALP